MKTDVTKQIKMTSRLSVQRSVAGLFTAVFHCLYKHVVLDYILINDTPFELHVFWPSETERRGFLNPYITIPLNKADDITNDDVTKRNAARNVKFSRNYV